ncbi:WTAP [Branchiostoma lanceolatum]|uniref:Pre-mRNA-splicing regulator WTAP n=1 Tax=Branchiostoma lanceolatum TaxID=7740 RepID=A0A8J9VA86_BRALA|nr:WTAP [Branchiostoma lanceolatum]
MSEGDPPPKRVKLSEEEVRKLPRDELVKIWSEQNAYVQSLETKNNAGPSSSTECEELTGLRESEEKLKQQQQESTRRENVLVMRLATKEQEMQEIASQIQEVKQGQTPGTAQLRTMLLDPAVNLLFTRMKEELTDSKDKLEQAQNELSAWKFTPDSQTGKKLISRCRMLIQENQELGRQLSQGRIAQLEGELALQKKYSEELKSSQDELNDFVIQLDEEVEGMQSTIYVLQQQLKDCRQQLAQAHQELTNARTELSHAKLMDRTERTLEATSESTEGLGPRHNPGHACNSLANHSSTSNTDLPANNGGHVLTSLRTKTEPSEEVESNSCKTSQNAAELTPNSDPLLEGVHKHDQNQVLTNTLLEEVSNSDSSPSQTCLEEKTAISLDGLTSNEPNSIGRDPSSPEQTSEHNGVPDSVPRIYSQGTA